YPPLRPGRSIGWQRIGREPLGGCDFEAMAAADRIRVRHENFDRIALAFARADIGSELILDAEGVDADFLLSHAAERRGGVLAALDGAAGKVPMGVISVLDEQQPAAGAEHDRAHAERHRLRDAPVETKAAIDEGGEGAEHGNSSI